MAWRCAHYFPYQSQHLVYGDQSLHPVASKVNRTGLTLTLSTTKVPKSLERISLKFSRQMRNKLITSRSMALKNAATMRHDYGLQYSATPILDCHLPPSLEVAYRPQTVWYSFEAGRHRLKFVRQENTCNRTCTKCLYQRRANQGAGGDSCSCSA
eukprot:jgi/Mesen1/2390/ME000157S01528